MVKKTAHDTAQRGNWFKVDFHVFKLYGLQSKQQEFLYKSDFKFALKF